MDQSVQDRLASDSSTRASPRPTPAATIYLQVLNRYQSEKLTDTYIECTYARLYWEAITAGESSGEAPRSD